MNESVAVKYDQEAVPIGPSGAAWPFVPHKQPGALFFEYSRVSGNIMWSSGNAKEVLGMSDAAAYLHGSLFLAHVHGTDRFRVESLLEKSLLGELPYVVTYRWIRPDSSEIRYLHARAMLDPDGATFRGMVVDITEEVSAIRSDPDLATTAGDSLNLLSIDGIVLDLEFRIRGVFKHHPNLPLTFGLSDLDPSRLRPGQSLPECFLSRASQEHVHRVLEQALELGGEELAVEWSDRRARVNALLRDGVPNGIAISIFDVSHEHELARENRALLLKLNQLSEAPACAEEVNNLSQELVGYAALIQRQLVGNAVLEPAAEALVSTARKIGEHAHKLLLQHKLLVRQSPVENHVNVPTEKDEKTAPQSSGRCDSPQVLLASSSNSSSTNTLNALLRDAGLHSLTSRFDEMDIREKLISNGDMRVIVLDIPHRDFKGAPLIRSLRKVFPELRVICLVPGPIQLYPALRRAGSFLLIPKPVTSEEIERLVRGVLLTPATQK